MLTKQLIRAAQIAQIKHTLEQNGYSVTVTAMLLGLHRTKLSHMLNDNKALRSWWLKVRQEKKKASRRARQQRWRDKQAISWSQP